MSHRTVREPADEELAELERMKRQEVGRVSVCAHIVLLSNRGYSASEIAEIHDVAGPMVYKWFDRFDEEGASGQRPSPEAPPKKSRQKRVDWRGTAGEGQRGRPCRRKLPRGSISETIHQAAYFEL